MSGKAHRARRDTSEGEVIAALEACGWQVKKLAQKGIPDLMVCKAGTVKLVEVKTGNGKHRETQDWDVQGWPVVTLRTTEQVFAWAIGETVRMKKGG